LPRLFKSGWNGHWSISLQSNQRLSVFLCVDVAGYKIINVCKPPSSRLTPTAIPTSPHHSLYVGDFNCQHVNWGYSKTSPDDESLDLWATANNLGLLAVSLKGSSQFILSPIERWHQPGLGLRECRPGQLTALGKFPRPQVRPFLIRLPSNFKYKFFLLWYNLK